MKSDYLAIFEKRGQSYNQAMQKYPHARNAEFQRLLDNIPAHAARCILDVPSGGGYLAKFFPPETEIHSLEPCKEFTPKLPHLTADIDLETLTLPANTYDAVICLAAIHHVKNKPAFFAQCQAALQNKGYFCVGDIERSNPIATFLDVFAGAHNGTGHSGYYLTAEEVRQLADSTGFTVINTGEKPCHWVFNNHAEMLDFCRLLFGLSASDTDLQQALEKYIGISEHQGKIRLHWTMLYTTLQKNKHITQMSGNL